MAKTVRDYLLEKGIARDLAVGMDEITLAMHSRIYRFNKQGVTKHLVMIDMGAYRHLEQKSAKSFQELQRMMLDYGLFLIDFMERFKLLEQYGIVKLNVHSGEYEFTDFGKTLLDTRRV